MDDIFREALNKMISEVESKIEELNKNPLFEEINKKKKLINEFSLNYGGDIVYKDVDVTGNVKSSVLSITPGQFKGWTLSKAVRWYLEARGKENPPTYDEILEVLKKGDYDGKVSNIKKAILKNNQISTLKGGEKLRFGLTEWYSKGRKSPKAGTDDETNDDELEENDNGDDPDDELEETDKDTTEE